MNYYLVCLFEFIQENDRFLLSDFYEIYKYVKRYLHDGVSLYKSTFDFINGEWNNSELLRS